jgi:hypothetical protein
MEKRGYEGHFAPKPASSCLQVSANGDGCAIFVKRRRLRVVSRETVTFELSQDEVSMDVSAAGTVQGTGTCQDGDGDGGLPVTDKGCGKGDGTKDRGKGGNTSRRAQNQVALMVLCEFVGGGVGADADSSSGGDGDGGDSGAGINDALDDRAPYLILCTTHLKAAKTQSGEQYRVSEVTQLLESVARLHSSLGATPYTPAVVVTGDFNAVPCYEMEVPKLVGTSGGSQSASAVYFSRIVDAVQEQEQEQMRGGTTTMKSYEPLTYRTVKAHPLMFRSVYNDDVPEMLSSKEHLVRHFYTTWKARRRGSWGEEQVVKDCIDYIFYVPGDPPLSAAATAAAAAAAATAAAAAAAAAGGSAVAATAAGGGELTAPVLAPAPRIAAQAVLDVFSDAEVGHQLLPSDLYPSDHMAIAADLRVSWDVLPRADPLRR